MNLGLGIEAFYWGILSAISLPAGAALGLAWRPQARVNSAFMAFGAGALLFALTIELFGHVPHHVHNHGFWAFGAAAAGALLGGLLFDTLNQYLNNKGAFIRSLSTAKKYLIDFSWLKIKLFAEKLSHSEVFRKIPPAHMAQILGQAELVKFPKDQIIFSQNESPDAMYFVLSGEVEIIREGKGADNQTVALIKPGDFFGEMGLLSQSKRVATAKANCATRLLRLDYGSFLTALREVPALKEALCEVAEQRAHSLDHQSADFSSEEWHAQLVDQLQDSTITMSRDEVHQAIQGEANKEGAAMAIWLGLLIDGIPESLVIGMLAGSASGMSVAFIAGVFLANLPESMSSSVSMKKAGMPFKKILFMWGSLTLITGIGAFLGAIMLPSNPVGSMFYFVLAIEGLAAGAMLTMIAETMLPEAFHQGGAIVGLSTLLGFLVALLVKVL